MKNRAILIPALLSAALAAIPNGAAAQGSGPNFSDINTSAQSRPATASARNKADRNAILFLSNHVKELDTAIAQTREIQKQVLEEARQREEEARQRAAEAERRRREANSRAAGNALLLIAGADPKDINTYNRVMDVHDIVTARTPTERRAANQQVVAPTALLLLGADVRTVNDLDQFSSAFGAISAGSNARATRQELEKAQRGSQAAAGQANSLDDTIRKLEAERSRALDLLHGYSARYLAEVNGIVEGVSGFGASFGKVKDLAFDFSLSPESPDPLILALTFRIGGETVDVRLKDIDEFLGDHFAKLIATREGRVAELEKAASGKDGELQSLLRRRADLEGQVRAKEQQKASMPGIRNVFARERLDREIAQLKQSEQTQAAEGGARSAVQGAQEELRKARALVARAKTAREMLGKIDASAAADALVKVRALL